MTRPYYVFMNKIRCDLRYIFRLFNSWIIRLLTDLQHDRNVIREALVIPP